MVSKILLVINLVVFKFSQQRLPEHLVERSRDEDLFEDLLVDHLLGGPLLGGSPGGDVCQPVQLLLPIVSRRVHDPVKQLLQNQILVLLLDFKFNLGLLPI